MTELQRLSQHVLQGLSLPQKALSSAWFYDDEGSRLFQQIMALPAYYLTRVEHALLRDRSDELARWIDPDGRPLDLVELGSGDGEKTLSLCRVLHQRGIDCIYRPMDVSAHALADLGRRFSQQLPQLAVAPVLGNYFEHWPAVSPQRRQVAMLLGSNLGNFDEDGAVALLQRIHAMLRPGDALLLGLDLVKDPHVLRAAYDDPQGVTAAFNLNLLRRLNRELRMDFDLAQFGHFASYCPLQGTARSFLVSRTAQTVSSSALDRQFHFRAGETIYTEQSQKYTPASIEHLARRSGFINTQVLTDAQDWYALAVWHRDAGPA
jgi:dimethylhistidine N-methyltransferase